jgi:hypothetical protein
MLEGSLGARGVYVHYKHVYHVLWAHKKVHSSLHLELGRSVMFVEMLQSCKTLVIVH